MTNSPSLERLLPASRITGLDLLFIHHVQQLSLQLTGSPTISDPSVRARIEALRQDFRRNCASIFQKHLGEQADECLSALETAPLQYYLAARRAMAGSLQRPLAELRRRMGNIQI